VNQNAKSLLREAVATLNAIVESTAVQSYNLLEDQTFQKVLDLTISRLDEEKGGWFTEARAFLAIVRDARSMAGWSPLTSNNFVIGAKTFLNAANKELDTPADA